MSRMPILRRVRYEELNPKQQENYNFHRISAILAEYGFTTLRLTDDWQGADFLAQHREGEFLKVQLKGRLCFDKKYINKDVFIAFSEKGSWYLYPHDELLNEFLETTDVGTSSSWQDKGGYSFPYLSVANRARLERYRIWPQPMQNEV